MSERQLSDLAELSYGKSPNGFRTNSSAIPLYGTSGVIGYATRAMCNSDAVVLPRKGSLGNPWFANAGFWAIDTTYVATPQDGIDAKWLYYALSSLDLTKLNEATGVPSISRDWLGKLRIRTPTLIEQRRIAALLSAIDAQIELSEQECLKIAMRRVGLFDDLLNAALINPSDDISAGGLTDGWRRSPLAQVTSKILDFRGKTPLKLGMSWGGGSIPALSANNVEMGRINLEKECYFASEALYNRWMTNGDCSKDDVVMTLEAPLGNVALIPNADKYILSQRVVLLKPNLADVDGTYLYVYLRWRRFQELLAKNSTGTTATGIRRKALESLPVLVPSPQQRERITATLLSCLELESDWALEIEKLQALKRGLMAETLVGPQEKRPNS